jgi:limonene-1,2-epoxide hydrolase
MMPEEVVRAELASLASLDVDQIMAHLADDATFLPGFSFPTYSGLNEIRRAMEGFLKVMTKCDIEIVNLAVAGNVVLTERVDRLIVNGKPVDAPGMGRSRFPETRSPRGGTTSTRRRTHSYDRSAARPGRSASA